jgi:NADPH2:quinone reductase
MKAVWYNKQGSAREVLNYGDMPTPEAGSGGVRIKLQGSAVNPSDTYRRVGPRLNGICAPDHQQRRTRSTVLR